MLNQVAPAPLDLGSDKHNVGGKSLAPVGRAHIPRRPTFYKQSTFSSDKRCPEISTIAESQMRLAAQQQLQDYLDTACGPGTYAKVVHGFEIHGCLDFSELKMHEDIARKVANAFAQVLSPSLSSPPLCLPSTNEHLPLRRRGASTAQ